MSKVVKKLKTTTIDDLAQMVAKGFLGVGERFDRLEKRFYELEHRVNNIDETVKMIRVEKKENADQYIKRSEFNMIVDRVSRIEKKIK